MVNQADENAVKAAAVILSKRSRFRKRSTERMTQRVGVAMSKGDYQALLAACRLDERTPSEFLRIYGLRQAKGLVAAQGGMRFMSALADGEGDELLKLMEGKPVASGQT